MFKFIIIESQQQIAGNKSSHSLVKKIKFLQERNMSLRNQHNFIFIITAETEQQIAGGVCVSKNNLKNVQEDIKELVTTLNHSHGYIWECSNIYIETSSKYPLSGITEPHHILQDFYRGLYEGLVQFAKQKGVGFVIVKLTKDIYASTKEFGLWPYVVELKPENSPDGLFHGILPLTGSQYVTYQKTWETLK